MKHTARLPQSNVNVTPTSPLREFFVLTLGLLGIAVCIYLLLGLAADLIMPRISIDLEKKMATLFVRSVSEQVVDPERERVVQSLVESLQVRCVKLPYALKVHIRKAPTVNALALPGGHVIIFTGLLEKVASENELAFVLAHEMGHYAHRDHLRGVGRAIVFIAISSFFFGPDSSVSKMLANALNITQLSFSRQQETRADEFALETLYRAYGHVAGATDFFEKIPKALDPGKFGHYFASHPENRRRISHLESLIRSKGFELAERKPLPQSIKRSKPLTPTKP